MLRERKRGGGGGGGGGDETFKMKGRLLYGSILFVISMFYLTTHSIHFNHHSASDVWLCERTKS